MEQGELIELLAFELVEYRREWSQTGKQCEIAWSVGMMAAASRGAKVGEKDFKEADYFVPDLARTPKKKRKPKPKAEQQPQHPQRSGLESWMVAMANPKQWGR